MHLNKGKTLAQCRHDRMAYAMNPDKTQERELIFSYECDVQTVESEFLLSKRESGCKIKAFRNPSIRLGAEHRFARFDTLGRGYSAEELRAIITGTKKVPQRKRPGSRKQKQVNLLVDIQQRIQGKGPGYERWAKSFNLKQMARTVLYLQEHDLLEYAVLAERTREASAHFHALSSDIKAAEKRMAEVSVLRMYIVNYAKTREV